MDFETLRKRLGDPRQHIVFEYKQNPTVYTISASLMVLTASLAILMKWLNHPALTWVILTNIILGFTISVLIKRSGINLFPTDKELLSNLNEKQFEDFHDFLKGKLSIVDLSLNLSVRSFDNWVFNFGFSGLFSLLVYFSNKVFGKIETILSIIVIFSFVCQGYYVYKNLYLSDHEVTVRALRASKNFRKG